jgi:hypothetical protein
VIGVVGIRMPGSEAPAAAGAGRQRRKRGAGTAAFGDRLRLAHTPSKPRPAETKENHQNIAHADAAEKESTRTAFLGDKPRDKRQQRPRGLFLGTNASNAHADAAEKENTRTSFPLHRLSVLQAVRRDRVGTNAASPSRSPALKCGGLLEDTPPPANPRPCAGASRATDLLAHSLHATKRHSFEESCCLLLPETPKAVRKAAKEEAVCVALKEEAGARSPSCEQPAAAPRYCAPDMRSVGSEPAAACGAAADDDFEAKMRDLEAQLEALQKSLEAVRSECSEQTAKSKALEARLLETVVTTVEGCELLAQSAVSADGLWVRREVFEQARKKAKSDLIELESELMSIILAMEAAYTQEAPPQWDEAGVGGWVRREILEKVKIKAKQDLVDLESELMTVILSMEAESNQSSPLEDAESPPAASPLSCSHHHQLHASSPLFPPPPRCLPQSSSATSACPSSPSTPSPLSSHSSASPCHSDADSSTVCSLAITQTQQLPLHSALSSSVKKLSCLGNIIRDKQSRFSVEAPLTSSSTIGGHFSKKSVS